MEESKSSANTFGTFLETLKQVRSESKGTDVPADQQLVRILMGGPKTTVDLQSESALADREFSEAIDELRAAKMIEVDVFGGQEVVSLTQRGSQMAESFA
jgi:hypothetical protein